MCAFIAFIHSTRVLRVCKYIHKQLASILYSLSGRLLFSAVVFTSCVTITATGIADSPAVVVAAAAARWPSNIFDTGANWLLKGPWANRFRNTHRPIRVHTSAHGFVYQQHTQLCWQALFITPMAAVDRMNSVTSDNHPKDSRVVAFTFTLLLLLIYNTAATTAI